MLEKLDLHRQFVLLNLLQRRDSLQESIAKEALHYRLYRIAEEREHVIAALNCAIDLLADETPQNIERWQRCTVRQSEYVFVVMGYCILGYKQEELRLEKDKTLHELLNFAIGEHDSIIREFTHATRYLKEHWHNRPETVLVEPADPVAEISEDAGSTVQEPQDCDQEGF